MKTEHLFHITLGRQRVRTLLLTLLALLGLNFGVGSGSGPGFGLSLGLNFGTEAKAAMTHISGRAPQFANHNIVFSCYADMLSRLRQELLTVVVDADGNFSADIDLSEVTYVWTELGVYRGYIYLEPGARYEIALPPFIKKSDADRFNPFFEYREVNLTLKAASSDLNMAIRQFDAFFDKALVTNAVTMVRHKDRDLSNRLMQSADSAQRAIGCRKPFFLQHVLYRKAQLFAASRLNQPKVVLKKFYMSRPVLYNMPAYWHTLDMLNPDIFRDLVSINRQKRLLTLFSSVSQPSFTSVNEALATDSLLGADRQLREMLLVRQIRSAFYGRTLAEVSADVMLTQAASQCHAQRTRLVAANIYARKNKLRSGLPAPELNLVDNADREVNIADYKGRFLYLCFMHTQNYECQKVMAALDNLAQLHKDNLDVLCIFTDDDADAMYASIAKRPHMWRGVSMITNQRLMEEYEIRGLPTYFLIAPDGCIEIAQAPGPSENVGPAIASAIRNYILTQKRGRPDIPRTIYDVANGTNK